MCRMLNVSPSGYYAWLNRKPSRHAMEDERLEAEIKAAYKRNCEVLASETIECDLKEYLIKVGICRIKRKLGIRYKQIKKFKAIVDSKHALPVAENLLDQNFKAEAAGQVWVFGITHIPNNEGWLYLCCP